MSRTRRALLVAVLVFGLPAVPTWYLTRPPADALAAIRVQNDKGE